MKALVTRYPVLSYVVLCYAITWSVWFAIPIVAGEDWTLVKILVGVGMGPGLAAVLLDRLRGTGGRMNTVRWWACFTIVFGLVAAVSGWSLAAGEARSPADYAAATAPGWSVVGAAAALLAAAVIAFVFASAATSRSATLRTVLAWRMPIRWWLFALFLPAALSLIGLAATAALGGEMPASVGGGLPAGAWAAFVVRSTLYTLLVVGIGEEVGWRGWMLPELQKRFSPLVSSIVLGLVWGFWHFPLFFNGAFDAPPEQIVSYLVAVPVLAVVFTWMYNRTAGSLVLAAVLHAALNNTDKVLPESWSPALMLALAVVVVVTGRMWRRGARHRAAAPLVPA